jgi:quercetin dioxygenase-like cupin family protein
MTSQTENAAPVRVLPEGPVPYRLADGDGRAALLLGQVGRTLASTEQTNGAMSVMSALGPAGRPIPLHYHEREHDYFLCVRGAIQVWADGESRILTPGDVASIPPGVVHAYRFHGHYSQFIGPIAPAGWDRFFDFCGTPYDGPAYPQVDPSPPPFEKFGAAQEMFSMTYLPPDTPLAPAGAGPDDALPGTASPYFLRAGEGPRHTLLGQNCFQVMTGAESSGALGMTITEGPRGAPSPVHLHERAHEAIFCLDGVLAVALDGDVHRIGRGDFLSIPRGTAHSYALEGHLTRFVTMYGPAGPERLYELAGEVAEHRIFPDEAAPVDPDRLARAGVAADTTFTG